jgi:hypothetical protein
MLILWLGQAAIVSSSFNPVKSVTYWESVPQGGTMDHYVLDTYKSRLEESRPKPKIQKTFTKRSLQATGMPIFGGSYDASKEQRRWGHIAFKENTNEL